MSMSRFRPSKTRRLKDPNADAEVAKLFRMLQQYLVDEDWRFITTDDGIYLQYYSQANKKYESKVFVDTSGNVKATGAFTGSQTLDDVGGY